MELTTFLLEHQQEKYNLHLNQYQQVFFIRLLLSSLATFILKHMNNMCY